MPANECNHIIKSLIVVNSEQIKRSLSFCLHPSAVGNLFVVLYNAFAGVINHLIFCNMQNDDDDGWQHLWLLLQMLPSASQSIMQHHRHTHIKHIRVNATLAIESESITSPFNALSL